MILILALSGLLTIDSGNETIIANAISREFKKPVVILVDPKSRWTSRSIKYTSDLNLPNYVGSKLGLVAGNPKLFGFGKPAYPYGFFSKQKESKYSPLIPTADSDEIATESNGRVTFSLPNESATTLYRLRLLKTMSKLKWHWFYNSARLSIAANNALPEELEKAVAGALGAKLSETGGAPYLDLDIRQFRSRVGALMDKMAKDENLSLVYRADSEYYAELIRRASDAQIKKAFEKPGSQVTVHLPSGTKLHDLALRRLDVAFATPGLAESSGIQLLKSKVDFDEPAIGVLHSDGRIVVIYSGRKGSNEQFVY
jgi:hypothetical protein